MKAPDHPKLTIGMACYDDCDGVFFTIQAIQLYHSEVMPEAEIVVVDNNPEGAHGAEVRDFVVNWVQHGRYIPYTERVGTSAPRDQIFQVAQGNAVLCLDAHVLLVPHAVEKLIQYYDDHPDCGDLLHGPLLYDDCRSISTHMKPVWNDQMFGVWDTDPRGVDLDAEPFEIPMHGCGLFSCRKAAWLGFHPGFRGFGGEEGYIHKKFQRRGQRSLCLPFLRWNHRFRRPAGVAYSLRIEDRIRNYLLGHQENGESIEEVLEHFSHYVPPASLSSILAELELPAWKSANE